MKRLRTRLRFDRFQNNNNHLHAIVRYQSNIKDIKSSISIGAALPPDEDELSSYAYYNSKLNKPGASQSYQSTITKSSSSNALTKMFSKENITAPYTYNRWLIPPAALAVHMSIGSVYAWSIFNSPLTRELGVVAAAPGMLITVLRQLITRILLYFNHIQVTGIYRQQCEYFRCPLSVWDYQQHQQVNGWRMWVPGWLVV